MRMMNIPHTWKYFGFVCFPNLENRQTLINAGAVKDEDEVKVFINSIQFNQVCRLSKQLSSSGPGPGQVQVRLRSGRSKF